MLPALLAIFTTYRRIHCQQLHTGFAVFVFVFFLLVEDPVSLLERADNLQKKKKKKEVKNKGRKKKSSTCTKDTTVCSVHIMLLYNSPHRNTCFRSKYLYAK